MRIRVRVHRRFLDSEFRMSGSGNFVTGGWGRGRRPGRRCDRRSGVR